MWWQFLFLFFFKQKTAYEMRISDWSSDVCSSDLAERPVNAVGIASFGPVNLDPGSSHFGHILTTPKPGWSGADILGSVQGVLTCPVAIDTDVNGAALAEYRRGVGQDCDSLCYLPIGTGIGGGLVINGAPVHGPLHPEIGPVRGRRAPGDNFPGIYSFHGDCVDGLTSD